MAERTLNAGATRQFASEARHPAIDASIRIVRNPVGGGSAIVLFGLIGAAVVAWAGFGGDPYTSLGGRLDSPNREFLFGTDQIGRDVFARLLNGAWISLYVGLLSSFIGTTIGMAVGIASAYWGGKFDLVVQRVIDAMIAFPGIILAIAIMAFLGQGLVNLIIALVLSRWGQYCRVVRGEVLTLSQREFVEAARAGGYSSMRIMWRHIFPNILAPAFVLASYYVAVAVIAEAALSFIGLGAQPPTPSLGQLVADGRNFLRLNHWESTIPGIAIVVVVLSVSLIGDGLRDVFDPRLRHEAKSVDEQ